MFILVKLVILVSCKISFIYDAVNLISFVGNTVVLDTVILYEFIIYFFKLFCKSKFFDSECNYYMYYIADTSIYIN